MTKIYNYLLIFIAILLVGTVGYSQQLISEKISEKAILLDQTEVISLSKEEKILVTWNRAISPLESAVYFKTEKNDLIHFLKDKPTAARVPFMLPDGNTVELRLLKSDVFTEDFKVYLASNRNDPFPFVQGVHYWGIIEGDASSLAAISVFPDEISGMIRYQDKHYTIGRLEDSSDASHILYQTDELDIPMDFQCGTDPEIHTIGSNDDDDAEGSRSGGK